MNNKIKDIARNLATQNNRATSDPIFVVERKRLIYGVDEDMAEAVVWVRMDEPYDHASPDKHEKLERKWARTSKNPKKWRRMGVVAVWEFVTACLTEQGCRDYLAANGHNLGETRIYAYSAYRNDEMIALRDYLLALETPVIRVADGAVIDIEEHDDDEQ